MNFFRLSLIAGWLAIIIISFVAFNQDGLIAGEQFVADITTLSWRSQFNVDFLVHLVLFSAWVAWRHRFSALGIVLSISCVLGGGVISIAYIFLLTITCKGNMRQILLGKQPRFGE
ncbi:hypothetical protein [Pseudomonas sp. NFX15]|uniref:hypothetical protein n=1 Tax=Pseudomonas sp. NFX15 TaxID=2816958 RepID=UPI003B8B463B